MVDFIVAFERFTRKYGFVFTVYPRCIVDFKLISHQIIFIQFVFFLATFYHAALVSYSYINACRKPTTDCGQYGHPINQSELITHTDCLLQIFEKSVGIGGRSIGSSSKMSNEISMIQRATNWRKHLINKKKRKNRKREKKRKNEKFQENRRCVKKSSTNLESQKCVKKRLKPYFGSFLRYNGFSLVRRSNSKKSYFRLILKNKVHKMKKHTFVALNSTSDWKQLKAC